MPSGLCGPLLLLRDTARRQADEDAATDYEARSCRWQAGYGIADGWQKAKRVAAATRQVPLKCKDNARQPPATASPQLKRSAQLPGSSLTLHL